MLEEMLRGGSRGIVGFDPTTIPGCTVWFDAADIGTMSLSVSSLQTWRSKGSASCTATYKYNAPSVSTISGLSSIYFNGVSTMMTTNSIASYGAIETTWITCAVNLTTVSGSTPADACPVIATSGAGAERAIRYTCNVNATAYSMNTSVLRQTTGDNTNGVRGFIDTAAYFAGFTNGSLITSNTTAVTFQAGVNQSFVMGQWNVGWLNGYVYEILIYNRALSLGEYQSVEGYLSQKWGFSPAKVFTPTSIPGCSIWFDAADMSSLTTSGTNITSWTNKGSIPLVAYPLTGGLGTPVGGGTNSNAYGGFLTTGASINGLNAVNCPQQTTYGMSSTVTFPTQARAVFAVYRAASAGAAPYITFFGCLTVVPNNQNGMANYVQHDGQGPVLFAEVGAGAGSILGGGSPAGTFPVNTTGMIAWVQSAISTGNNFVTMNGVPQTITTNQLATTYVTTPQYYFIGSAYTQAYTFCEYIMFNSEISISQRQAVEGYLAWKWGFQGSLGVTHPNYLTTGNFVKSLTLATTHPYYSLPPATRVFTPLDVPGCQIWLDAADLSSFTFSSGTTISSWKDKSGFGNNFTSTAGTNTRIADGAYSVVSFSTGNYMSSTNQVPLALTSSFFVVVKVLDIGGFNMIVGCTNITSGGNLSDFSIRIIDGLLNGTSAKLGNEDDIGNQTYYVNGSFNPNFGTSTYNNTYSIIDTMVSGKSGTTYITLSSAFGSNRYLKGNIAEFLFYPGGVTGAQRQAVEGYLADKWGLKPQLPAFVNPRSIPSCAMWLDGSDPAGTGVAPANNSAIATWVDKSGNGCNATASSSNPTFLSNQYNGYGLINFSGGVYFSNATFNYNLPNRTLFIVCSSTVAGYTGFLSFNNTSGTDYSASNTMNYSSPGTNSLQIAAALSATGGGFNIFFGTGSTTQFAIYGDTFSGTTETYFMNGSNMGSTTTSTTFGASTSIYIGARQLGGFTGTYSITGTISELIIYNYAITSSQRQQVEGYLAWKWGLQAQLPATHPFYAAAPLPHSFNKVPPTIRQPALYYDVTPGNWARDWQPYLRALVAANSTGVTLTTTNITGGATFTANGYQGSVLAPNGNIYFCPVSATNVLVLNPTTGVTSNITGGATYQSFGWAGGVLATNGNIYFGPQNASNILVLNPNTGVTSNLTGGVTWTTNGWLGGVLAPNGNIYFAPFNSSSVLVLNTTTGVTSTITGGASYTSSGWNGGVLAPNGNIYFAPCRALNIFVLNPNTGATSNITGGATYIMYGWTKGVLAPNGNIYFAPDNAANILVLNPNTGATSNITGSASYTSSGSQGGLLGPDGNIYFTPHNAGNFLVLNPNTGATSNLTGSAAYTAYGWAGGVLAPNGRIYCAPYSATNILTVSFTGLLQTPSLNYCMSAYTNKL